MNTQTIKKMVLGGSLALVLLGSMGSYTFAQTQQNGVIAASASSDVQEFQTMFESIDAIITDHEWETLSMKAIDEKLNRAGIEAIGDPQDPLYAMSMAEIDALSDAEFDKLVGDYYDDFDIIFDGEDEEFEFEYDFDQERTYLLEEGRNIFEAIKTKLDETTRNTFIAQFDVLENTHDEEKFFDIFDGLYDLAEDEIEAYFVEIYGDEDIFEIELDDDDFFEFEINEKNGN